VPLTRVLQIHAQPTRVQRTHVQQTHVQRTHVPLIHAQRTRVPQTHVRPTLAHQKPKGRKRAVEGVVLRPLPRFVLGIEWAVFPMLPEV